MNTFTKTLIVAAFAAFTTTSAMAYDRPNNPPGPVGGHGTNWHNPPGPVGGHGASPSWHHRAMKRAVVHQHRHHHHRYYVHHHFHQVAAHAHPGMYR